jgi:hypothetical protein
LNGCWRVLLSNGLQLLKPANGVAGKAPVDEEGQSGGASPGDVDQLRADRATTLRTDHASPPFGVLEGAEPSAVGNGRNGSPVAGGLGLTAHPPTSGRLTSGHGQAAAHWCRTATRHPRMDPKWSAASDGVDRFASGVGVFVREQVIPGACPATSPARRAGPPAFSGRDSGQVGRPP